MSRAAFAAWDVMWDAFSGLLGVRAAGTFGRSSVWSAVAAWSAGTAATTGTAWSAWATFRPAWSASLTAGASGTARTAGATGAAELRPGAGLGEADQFSAVEFPVAVSVKGKSIIGEPFRCWGILSAWATLSTWTFGSAGRTAFAVRGAGWTAFGPFRRSGRTWWSSIGPIGWSRGTAFRAIGGAGRSWWSSFRPFRWSRRSSRTTGWPQFVFRECAIAIGVEFLQRGRSVDDFFGRDFTVVISVEGLYDGVGAWRSSTASAGALRTALRWWSRWSAFIAWRLGDSDGNGEQCRDRGGEREQEFFHGMAFRAVGEGTWEEVRCTCVWGVTDEDVCCTVRVFLRW